MPSRRKGYDKERELARKLWDAGFATLRAPASGAKAKHIVQPDLVVAREGRIFVVEVKARRKIPVYIERSQVDKLVDWATRAGGEAMIALYTDGEWLLFRVDGLDAGGSGSVRIGREDVGSAIRLAEFIAGRYIDI